MLTRKRKEENKAILGRRGDRSRGSAPKEVIVPYEPWSKPRSQMKPSSSNLFLSG